MHKSKQEEAARSTREVNSQVIFLCKLVEYISVLNNILCACY